MRDPNSNIRNVATKFNTVSPRLNIDYRLLDFESEKLNLDCSNVGAIDIKKLIYPPKKILINKSKKLSELNLLQNNLEITSLL